MMAKFSRAEFTMSLTGFAGKRGQSGVQYRAHGMDWRRFPMRWRMHAPLTLSMWIFLHLRGTKVSSLEIQRVHCET